MVLGGGFLSYAIIRNVKYKMGNLNGISKHNERKNKNYSNKDIDHEKSDLNYHLKKPIENSYEREFYRLREENNLKGNLRLTGKKQSNVACEFLITSDNEFFNKIGAAETKRYFETAYDFACKKCGEKNIISAVVHMDETTPHLHLTYIPVVTSKNKKGEKIEKVNCSEFWKGFNSYGDLQDSFYNYVIERGFNLERGITSDRNHLEVMDFKAKTLEENVKRLETERNKLQSDLKALRDDLNKYKGISIGFNDINRLEGKESLLNREKIVLDKHDFEYLKDIAKKQLILEKEFKSLKKENQSLKNDVQDFNKYQLKVKKENWVLKREILNQKEKLEIFQDFIKENDQVKNLDNFLEERNKEIELQKENSWELEM